MENRGTHKLNSGKKLLLAFACAGSVIGPLFAGMMSAAESPIAAVREMKLPVSGKRGQRCPACNALLL